MRSITSATDAPCSACILTKLRTTSAISSRPPYPTAIVNVIKLYCAVAVSAARIAATQASLASVAAISTQDDSNMARRRLLFELVKEPALVNPIKKTEEQRSGRAFVRWLALRGVLRGVEPRRGSSSVKG